MTALALALLLLATEPPAHPVLAFTGAQQAIELVDQATDPEQSCGVVEASFRVDEILAGDVEQPTQTLRYALSRDCAAAFAISRRLALYVYATDDEGRGLLTREPVFAVGARRAFLPLALEQIDGVALKPLLEQLDPPIAFGSFNQYSAVELKRAEELGFLVLEQGQLLARKAVYLDSLSAALRAQRNPD